MNTPFLHTNSNSARPFQWKVRNVRGDYVNVGGRFASPEAAQKWLAKWQNETPSFVCR